MSYKVNFTNRTDDPHLTINDNTINTQTSLALPGRNQKGYAVSIAENFLHLLENFANTSAPPTPIKGQLWYDTTEGISELKVYDGTSWKPSGALKKGDAHPDITKSITGDLWVDTNNQQLYLFNGSNWVLVGPTFSSGLQTGAKPELLKDSSRTQIENAVLMNYVNDRVVAIASSIPFTPQSKISGFDTIKTGINLISDSNNTYKYWGVSEKAEALLVSGKSIAGSNFFQKTESNTTTGSIIVKNNSGLSVGTESQLQQRITDGKGVIYFSTPSSRLDINLNVGPVSHVETTLISLDASSGNIGIGSNNFSPLETLSVKGTGSFTGAVKITNNQDATDVNTAALVITGGAVIKKKLLVLGDFLLSGDLTTKNMLPVANNTHNIGSSLFKYNNLYSTNVYASDIYGRLTGNVTGTSTVSGRLSTSTVFSMVGDITSTGFSFDGATTSVTAGSFVVGRDYEITELGTTNFILVGASSNTVGVIFKALDVGLGTGVARELKRFNTTLSSTFINQKTAVTNTLDSDELIIYRPSTTGGNVPNNYKITKKNLVSNLPLVPIGAIFPFAGRTVPLGYLLCDGSEVAIGDYIELHNIIGDYYTPNVNTLVGKNTFRLPDLRGRFPLGKDDMNNSNQVPLATDQNVLVDAGGGAAGRVKAATASTIGNGAGTEQVYLNTSQLPQHQHNLLDTNGDQFYVTNNSSSPSVSGQSTLINGPTVSSSTPNQHLTTTGNIGYTGSVGQPVVVMNPYLTINYIIYTGVY
jgi:microcystin-dependent protein